MQPWPPSPGAMQHQGMLCVPFWAPAESIILLGVASMYLDDTKSSRADKLTDPFSGLDPPELEEELRVHKVIKRRGGSDMFSKHHMSCP